MNSKGRKETSIHHSAGLQAQTIEASNGNCMFEMSFFSGGGYCTLYFGPFMNIYTIEKKSGWVERTA